MILVVVRSENEYWNGRIINKCDAWEQNGISRMRREAREAGWVPMESEITFSGNMIIWVE